MAKLWLALIVALKLSAVEISAKTVDRLDRPLAGVSVRFTCDDSWFKLESDENGVVNGDAPCKPLLTFIHKDRFQDFATGLRSKYILDRIVDEQELSRIAALKKEDQLAELRALFAGLSSGRPPDVMFYAESQWRPALLTLAADEQQARSLLALIAAPDDLHFLVTLPPTPSMGDLWKYFVAASLIYPDDEAKWRFLEDCAAGKSQEHRTQFGAILTLKLTASTRGRKVLEQARLKNQNIDALKEIDAALEYIASNPAPFADDDLGALARRVAEAIDAEHWEKNGQPRFNSAHDKALIDLAFADCRGSYTATFHRDGGKWVLRALRDPSAGVIRDCVIIH